MSVLLENQINTGIGKNSIFASRVSLLCTQYACGIDYFDSLMADKSILGDAIPTNIFLHPTGVEISIMYRFKLQKIGIRLSDIKTVHIESKEKIAEYKEKSVIGRALLGGLLFGRAGAVVGALTAINTKENIIFTHEFILTIIYTDNNQEKAAVFTCKNDKRGELYRNASAVFGSKLQL